MRPVAEHGERFVPTADAANLLQRSPKQLSRTREALIVDHNILISEQSGTVSYAVPRFAAWLHMASPLTVPALRPSHARPTEALPPDATRPSGAETEGSGSAAVGPQWPKRRPRTSRPAMTSAYNKSMRWFQASDGNPAWPKPT